MLFNRTITGVLNCLEDTLEGGHDDGENSGCSRGDRVVTAVATLQCAKYSSETVWTYSFNQHSNFLGGYYYHFHFLEGETEAGSV